jgi:hypothetical protein
MNLTIALAVLLLARPIVLFINRRRVQRTVSA